MWRGSYDQQRLAEEVDYNVTAGVEILAHYLVDYAIRRDNTPARLRAIDDDFWRHYQTMKSSQWPAVSSCYAVGE